MWDGGWLFGGLLGHGDAFLCRDARGIRPGFVLERESFVAAASERAALATVFNAPMDEIVELTPGEVLRSNAAGPFAARPTPHNNRPRVAPLNGSTSAEATIQTSIANVELGERLAPKSLSDWETTCTTRCSPLSPTPPKRRPKGWPGPPPSWFDSNTPINSGTTSTAVRPNANSWTPSWSPPSAWNAWPTKINAAHLHRQRCHPPRLGAARVRRHP